MTELGLTDEDDRDRDMWRNLVMCKGRPLYIGQYEGWNFNSGNYLFTTDTK